MRSVFCSLETKIPFLSLWKTPETDTEVKAFGIVERPMEKTEENA